VGKQRRWGGAGSVVCRGMEEAATPQPEDVGAGADPFPITEEDAAAVEALPSDVEAAVLHLRELNPLGGLVLRDHVYSVIENRTRVDAELRRLRQENRIRIMHVPPSSARLMSGEVAIVLAEDLQAALDAVARVGSGKSVSTSPDNAALLGRFRCQVLDRCTATSVTQAAIEELLEGGQTSAKKRKRLGCCGEEIKRLIASGFLRPRRDVDAFEQEAFWFSVPAMGPFVQSLVSTGSRYSLCAPLGENVLSCA